MQLNRRNWNWNFYCDWPNLFVSMHSPKEILISRLVGTGCTGEKESDARGSLPEAADRLIGRTSSAPFVRHLGLSPYQFYENNAIQPRDTADFSL